MTTVAVIFVRSGKLPVGAPEAVAEAGGQVVLVGSDAREAARSLPGVVRARWCETGPSFRPGALARALAPVVHPDVMIVLPSSPDGRDLAPRLAAELGRPLVARVGTASVRIQPSPGVMATAVRVDDRVIIPVDVDGPAVVTLSVGGRPPEPEPEPSPDAVFEEIALDVDRGDGAEPELDTVLEPDVRTMDLADATRILGGGAGLVAGVDDRAATETFTLLATVAAALGASAGATRVATDAGWAGYERQIGTTGVTVDPDLYVAFGVSGATQHAAGLGSPRHVVSVNTDASCPMTAMADLGLVTDARALLVELARRTVPGSGDAAAMPGQEPVAVEGTRA